MDYTYTVYTPCEQGPVDFLEIFSGSCHATQACAEQGMRVGPPIDILTGFDLLTKAGQQQAWDVIRKTSPSVILLAPPCTAWSQMQNINNRRDVLAKQKAQLPLLSFVYAVCAYQQGQGKYFVVENPKTSGLWYQESMAQLLQLQGVNWHDIDLCRLGMVDPLTRRPYKKSLSLLTNIPEGQMRPLYRRCNHPRNSHTPCEGNAPGFGSRTKLSQVYPRLFCMLLARLLLAVLFVSTVGECAPSEDMKSLYLDLFESVPDKDIPQLRDYFEHHAGRCMHAHALQAATIGAVGPQRHIKDQQVRLAMASVAQMPVGTEILLGHDQHPAMSLLLFLGRLLRQLLAPT